MTKVLVSDPIDQKGIDILSQVAQVDVRTGLPADELKSIVGEYDALMIRSGTQVTADIIEATKGMIVSHRVNAPHEEHAMYFGQIAILLYISM